MKQLIVSRMESSTDKLSDRMFKHPEKDWTVKPSRSVVMVENIKRRKGKKIY